MIPSTFEGPGRDCALCPRLRDYLLGLRAEHGDWHNAPVPAFGPLTARLLVVGLAPGVRGANRTGRPFTGDYAGDLLYATIAELGLSRGHFDKRPDDGLELLDVRVTNAVRCVPPENKPTPAEQKTCRPFLVDEMAAMPNLKGILALGRISHEAILRTLGLKLKDYPFAHGALHTLPNGLILGESYHCSRYNQNTGRLTDTMFKDAVGALVAALG
jgi:uracil-DNA glycosylase family 4